MRQSHTELSKKLEACPYDPFIWLIRSKLYLKLHWPKLAMGDAHRAHTLIDESRKREFKYAHHVKYEIAKRLCDGPAFDGLLPTEVLTSDLGQIRIQNLLRETELNVAVSLAHALFFARSFTECLDVIRKALLRFPEEIDLLTLRKFAKEAYEEETQDMPKWEIEEQKSFGEIRLCCYPWMKPDFLCRTPSTVQYIQDNLKRASQGCSVLKSSNVRDGLIQSGEAIADVFGLFAAKDIAAHGIVLTDRTCLCAIDDNKDCCTSCSGSLPHRPLLLSCCKAIFCSNECIGLAKNFYHAAIYGKTIVDSHSAASASAGSPEYMTETRLLLRVLSCAVNFPDLHPLEAPIINRMTSTYRDSGLRRFSLAANIKRPFKILRQLGIDIFANQNFDTWVLHTIMIRVQNNSREYRGNGRFGIAINPLYSFFNHSCDPNVTYDVDCESSSGTLRMKTIRKVRAGNELFISYIPEKDLQEPVEERRKKLRHWFGGDCQCPRCRKESNEDSEEGIESDPDWSPPLSRKIRPQNTGTRRRRKVERRRR